MIFKVKLINYPQGKEIVNCLTNLPKSLTVGRSYEVFTIDTLGDAFLIADDNGRFFWVQMRCFQLERNLTEKILDNPTMLKSD